MSGQLHGPTALLPGDKHQILIGQEARWSPEQSEHGDEVDLVIWTTLPILFMYGLFNCTLSNSDNIVFNDKLISE
jgi:hypothetical protein